jgi:hypothetical protein
MFCSKMAKKGSLGLFSHFSPVPYGKYFGFDRGRKEERKGEDKRGKVRTDQKVVSFGLGISWTWTDARTLTSHNLQYCTYRPTLRQYLT